MYYKKKLIGLLICLLFFTHTVYGSYTTNYPIIMPKENPTTKSLPADKNEKTPKPNPYSNQFVTMAVHPIKFNPIPSGVEITCPTSAEEAKAMLNNDFYGNINEWSKFLTYCYIKYNKGYDVFEKQIITDENCKSIRKKVIDNIRNFYNYVFSSYITSLLDTNSLAILLSSIESDQKLALKTRKLAEPYLNNLIVLLDKAIKKAKDPNEIDLVANHGIKEIKEHIFKFMQDFGYYEFFTYILSDNFIKINKCAIDAALFKEIILFAETNIPKLANKEEIFTDLFSLFKVKLKEEYVLEDKKREAMELFMIRYQNETNSQISDLKEQNIEYMQQAERAKTELAKTKIQMQQMQKDTDKAAKEATELNLKIYILEEQKQESITKQKESQNKIFALEKQQIVIESKNKQFQTTINKQEKGNIELTEELTRLKKEMERLKKDIENQEKVNKGYVEILNNLEKESEQKIQELTSKIKELTNTNTYNEQLQQQNEQIKKEQKQLTENAKQLNTVIDQLKTQLLESKNKLTAATEQVQLWQQKIEKQDMAAKLAKQQNEAITNELKKTSQQLEQANKQLQLLKPAEKQKINEQQPSFFKKEVDRNKVIAHFKQIQQEFEEAGIKPIFQTIDGGWPKLAFVINALIDKYNVKDK